MVPNVQTLHAHHLNWPSAKEKEKEVKKKCVENWYFFLFSSLLLSVPDSIRYHFRIVSIACNRCDLISTENRHQEKKKRWKICVARRQWFFCWLLALNAFCAFAYRLVHHSIFLLWVVWRSLSILPSAFSSNVIWLQSNNSKIMPVRAFVIIFLSLLAIHESCNRWTSVDTHTNTRATTDWTNMKLATL